MARVFTITEGLENLGALKTGGQGSVYKGKRMGEIITAVKLLPTPIASEDPDNKHYIDFQNEVQKLKKVNEVPNPNVVKILNSGITETGGFPFIEMEFIEGPDLGELLKPPHDPVFPIKETIKVAEHLSNALAHCHKVAVKHGDIKSNNVKYNLDTGNYVLLDFGLAIMSDEQRRTSLRHAGAIEFMAPEQNEGQMLFQTDIYSFGIVIYELLAGQVPFPLLDNSETARNTVRVNHIEAPLPDLLSLREKNIPPDWPQEKKEREMQVPTWLTDMVYQCLEKKPEDRFANGIDLHEYIILNSTLTAKKAELNTDVTDQLQEENGKLLLEKDRLQQSLLHYQQQLSEAQKELQAARTQLQQQQASAVYAAKETAPSAPGTKSVSLSLFYALLLMTIIFGSLAAYGLFFSKKNNVTAKNTTPTYKTSDNTNGSAKRKITKNLADQNQVNKKKSDTPISVKKPAVSSKADADTKTTIFSGDDSITPTTSNQDNAALDNSPNLGQYKVKSKAYFYNEPDESTRRNAFIVHWNNAVLEPLDEKDDFVYIIYTNDEGQTSKGWLRKKDLIRIKE